ncbi:hypothetical protein [Pararhizobium haloflavum]|nr:hypothetical protein [Pararhizobium haloflavum]
MTVALSALALASAGLAFYRPTTPQMLAACVMNALAAWVYFA